MISTTGQDLCQIDSILKEDGMHNVMKRGTLIVVLCSLIAVPAWGRGGNGGRDSGAISPATTRV